MTSASGGALPTLQKSKRIVIAATKSGTEKNATVFPRYFIEGLHDPAADADKNEVITVLEAFRYAEAKTAKFYDELKRLSTEHPLIEDAGKGEGVKAPTVENGEGLLAGDSPCCTPARPSTMAKDPEKQKLLKQKEDVETKIDELKYRKASMPVEEYRDQLAQAAAGPGEDSGGTRQMTRRYIRLLPLALLSGLPLLAQAPATPKEALPAKRCATKATRPPAIAISGSRAPPIPRLQAEGFWGVGDFKSANDSFRAAVKLRDKILRRACAGAACIWITGRPPKRSDLFEEALKIKEDYAPALLGMALVAGEQFEGAAIKIAEKALEADPKLYEAYEVIARVHLEDGDPEKAAEAANAALKIYPEALDAMALLGTIDLLNDKKDSPWMTQALKINPHYGKAYAIAGHFFIINRRYDEGIAIYRKALDLDPTLNEARSDMGVNLMRLGQEDEARKQLEQAYNAGYQSPETVNSLRLLDSYKNYDTFKTPTTILRLNKKESALLRPYFQAEFDRALATYEKKYHYKLKQPVQIEVYPDHEDFAVRTLGMPGLGALGVTFGYVVAMDSPSARKPGQWHWASTMWHELSHVYALEMTNHPRSPLVHRRPGGVRRNRRRAGLGRSPGPRRHQRHQREEAAARCGSGSRLHAPHLRRSSDRVVFPGRQDLQLHRGEMGLREADSHAPRLRRQDDHARSDRKRIPDEAGGVRQTIHGLAGAANREDRRQLSTSGASASACVAGFVKDKKWDEAIKEGEAIRDMYTEYVEMGSVYEFLAQAWLAKGDKAKATAELERYSKVGGRDPAIAQAAFRTARRAGPQEGSRRRAGASEP